MRREKILVLATLVLLTDFYFVHPSVRLPVIAMAFLVTRYVLLRGFPKIALWHGTAVAKTLGAAFLFCAFTAVVDLSRGAAPYEVLVQLLSQALVAMMLPAFLDGGRPFPVTTWFRRFALVSLGFAVLQGAGFSVVVASLVPNFGVIGSDRILETLDSYGRATGATTNTIAFAMHMVMLALLAYAAFEQANDRRQIRYGLGAVVGLLLSQTRAALYGLIPAIVLSRLLLSDTRFRSIIKLAPVIALGGLGAWVLQLAAGEYLPYVAKEIDSGDTHRFWTNWYMAVGVFRESPLFGVAPTDAWDVYFRYGDMSVTQYRSDMATPTHHNQIGYYFRYYGFAGLVLLSFLYFRVWQAIKACESSPTRVFLGALLILDFIYSMAHNNKLIASPLIWIVLSMASLPAQQADAVLTGDRAR